MILNTNESVCCHTSTLFTKSKGVKQAIQFGLFARNSGTLIPEKFPNEAEG